MIAAEVPRLLTLEAAAALLPPEISVRTLRGLIRKGLLPHRQLGRRLFLTPDDLWRLTHCPANGSLPVSTSAPTAANGSSATATSPGGQAAALATAQALRGLCKPTSRPAQPTAPVVPLTRTN